MITLPLTFAAGALTWLLAEYFIHRFLGHTRAARKTAFGREHTRHHALGNYFAPTPKKVAAAVPVAAILLAISIPLAGPEVAMAYVSGFLSTYVLYEVLHRRAHTHPPRGPYGRWLRKHHFHHHFEDPSTNHGVTTPIGDLLLGTKRTTAKVRVPERLAMVWLIDPATNDVRAEHQHDYELVRISQASLPNAGAAAVPRAALTAFDRG